MIHDPRIERSAAPTQSISATGASSAGVALSGLRDGDPPAPILGAAAAPAPIPGAAAAPSMVLVDDPEFGVGANSMSSTLPSRLQIDFARGWSGVGGRFGVNPRMAGVCLFEAISRQFRRPFSPAASLSPR